MANAQISPALWDIRKLVAAQHTKERTDLQLLRAFAADNDHLAFATLVRRHGPLVMRVCRNVLQQTQDAEDAFQATFLVLARKATSIRKGGALVSWLHGVAYRMAMNAKRHTARRRQRERRARAAEPANPSWEVAWREVQLLLDEEIQRLPERYRAPFLLCCLENRSRADVAHQLGIKEGTVWSRLAQARKLLQGRLTRRGVTLSAVLGAAALSKCSSTAAVSDLLAETTARAAAASIAGQTTAGGFISAEVANQVKGVMRTMPVTRLKIATMLLLAGTLVAAGAGLLVRQTVAVAAEAPPGKEPPQSAAAPAPTAAAPRTPLAASPDTADEPVVLSGLVLGQDGKPASGVKLYLARNTFKSKADLPFNPEVFVGGSPIYLWDDPPHGVDLPLRATTGPAGRFSLNARRAELGYGALLVARAPGCGPDWAEVGQLAQRSNITLRLAPDDVAINGRVLDLEGRPIAGSTVTVVRVEKPATSGGPLSPEAIKPVLPKERTDKMVGMSKALGVAGGAPRPYMGAEVLDVPRSVKTGADGRFRLTGFGRDRLVRLRIQAPAIEDTYVTVQTRRDGEAGATRNDRIYPATFDYVAGPNWPIHGTVREKGTGKPLAGVTVAMGFSYADDKAGTVRTTTDSAGRYRLGGVSKTSRRRLVVAGGIPYLSSIKQIDETPGLEPLTVDFELERGMVFRGRLTDRSTGKPVRGLVSYYARNDNPHLKDFVDAGQLPLVADGRGEVGPDGSFTVVALPGPGLLCVWADDDRFTRAEGWDGQPLKTVPFPVNPMMFHTLVAISPSERTPSSTSCDIALEPGRTLTGSVVGPDGRPLTGVLAMGVTAVLPAARYQTRFLDQPPYQKLETAEFMVYGLNPRQPRALILSHPEKGLGKVQLLRGDESGPLTVRLEPLGALSGRVIDAEGHPWEGLQVTVSLNWDPTALKTLPYEALGRAGFFAIGQSELFDRSGTTDRDGRFRVEGLLPGLRYEIQPVVRGMRKGVPADAKRPFDVQRGLTVKAGETKDVGDLRSSTTPEKLAKE
jgi:RNA polymerase sigma factor (sigma-70 family)